MSTAEIKEQLLQMSPEERDDIMNYIEILRDDEEFELTEELKSELDKRMSNYLANPSSAKPWREVVGKIRP